ncbi:MAG TPA: extracellular solute-binding protein [Methylomirabilota bacterium]|nr:extracellular solute-binding protein [Methylomirabilota bacterium]
MSHLTRRQFLGSTAALGAAMTAPHAFIQPAWAQSKELKILAWSHFVPAYDKWLDQFVSEWAAKNNVRAVIDHIPHLQIPPKIAAEVATQSGHDIVQLAGSGTEKFAPALVDVQELADKLGRRHGGWTPLAENYSTYKGRFYSIPDYFIDFPGLYRKDLWSEIGMPNGPDTWDELLQGGRKLKAKGFPVGIGLAHHNDSRNSWRAIMWCYGGSEVAKDGKTITWNSKEVREGLKFIKALYKETMTPEVLAWDDASNNRFLASGRGSWIHNPISAYRTIEGSDKALAEKIHIQLSPRGPAGRLSFANCVAYGVTQFSKNQDTAKAFLEALTDNFTDAFRASTGYNNPFLKKYAKGPLPIISEDPKLKLLEKSPEYHYTVGYPGPLTPAADEIYQQFVMIDTVAQFCSDRLDLEAAVKWGEEKIRGIYAKFA